MCGCNTSTRLARGLHCAPRACARWCVCVCDTREREREEVERDRVECRIGWSLARSQPGFSRATLAGLASGRACTRCSPQLDTSVASATSAPPVRPVRLSVGSPRRLAPLDVGLPRPSAGSVEGLLKRRSAALLEMPRHMVPV